ncbi:hypothetical protein QYF61_009881 [Mycteria americana]|uniref:Rna-directed dna polymerase from mobile element jockey-like n=2 Tax=Mycteria americana TaxID=33587 RepID=A0AAN7RV00_MYCAM|nr:hypothetical protein QYF61_009881 [Mycteria americana]
MVTSGMKSSWGPVSSDVPQGSALGPVLFNSFSHDLEDGIKSMPSNLLDETKQGGGAATPQGWAAIQRDLGRLEQWADRNFRQFNKVYRLWLG